MRSWLLAAAILLALGGAAGARDYTLGDLRIDHPWARASIGRVPNGAAYLTIVTHGEAADRLVAVESDVAKRVSLHTHLMEGGVMKMRPVESVEIAPGEPTVLKPGGLHVMLMGLKAPLEEGARFPLTLIFERAGRIEVQVQVEAATATEPPADKGHKHGS